MTMSHLSEHIFGMESLIGAAVTSTNGLKSIASPGTGPVPALYVVSFKAAPSISVWIYSGVGVEAELFFFSCYTSIIRCSS